MTQLPMLIICKGLQEISKASQTQVVVLLLFLFLMCLPIVGGGICGGQYEPQVLPLRGHRQHRLSHGTLIWLV